MDQRGDRVAGPGVGHSSARAQSDHFHRFLELEQAKTGGRGKDSGGGRLPRCTLSVDKNFRTDRRGVGRHDRLRVRMRKSSGGFERNYPRHLVKALSNFTIHPGGGRGGTADCRTELELSHFAAATSDIRRSTLNDYSRGDLAVG